MPKRRRTRYCNRNICNHGFYQHLNPTPEGAVDPNNTACNVCQCPHFVWLDPVPQGDPQNDGIPNGDPQNDEAPEGDTTEVV